MAAPRRAACNRLRGAVSCSRTPAHAAEPTGLAATVGSVLMNDEFNSMGPTGTFWQPLITCLDVERLRFEVTALQQKGGLTSAGSILGSSHTLGQAPSALDSAAGSTAFSVSYALPAAGSWRTAVVGKRYVSSSYQKSQLAIGDYDSLLFSMSRISGQGSVESGLGYKFKRGLPRYAALSGAYGYVGSAYQLQEARSVEEFLDYRQSENSAGGYAAEVSAKFTQSIGANAKLEYYATQGVTRLNRDRAAGLLLNIGF